MKKLLLLVVLLLSGHPTLYCGPVFPAVGRLPKTNNLSSIERMARRKNCEPLLKAVAATRALYQKYDNLCFEKWEFLRTAYFIETHHDRIKAHRRFLSKKMTKLKHTIECDPSTNSIFIVLDTKKAFIGSGKKKKVFRSILYGQDPKLVARGEQSAPMTIELRAHRALGGVDGLMKTYAFTKHKDQDGKYTTIYSDLYQGAFRDILGKHKVSFYNKLVIINDILKGLDSIHSRGFVHRDLHAGNYLFGVERDDKGKKLIRVVISDLGRTIEINEANNVPAQGARRLYPPEGFKGKKLQGGDYYATDIYAVGSLFYWLYYDKRPKWQDDYMKDSKISQKAKSKRFFKVLKEETSKRRRYLSRRGNRGALSVKEKTEFLILRMLRKKPEQRGSASQWYQEAERILHEYRSKS